ncbi:MAG: ABC transporter ATP-binding protein [Pseudomonadota bacterium]
MLGGGVALECQGLSKSFGGFYAVRDVTLSIAEGTIHALIGPNGAGKTTCFNLLTKFLQPTEGRIRLGDTDITRAKPAEIANLGMIRSFQISSIFPHLTLLENVRVGLQARTDLCFSFWRSERCLADLEGQAMALLEEVDLADKAQDEARTLSYGRKRALELATTLARDPKVMLLDEPMAGMGREDIDRVAKLIKRVSAGRTVLMVEHNLNVVAEYSDRITVLARGEVLAEGTYSEISADPAVRTAYMGAH